DVGTLGNHEFDYGWMQTKKFVDTAKYPIVTSNLQNAAGKDFTPKPYVILKVNGLRVAVIGGVTNTLKTPDTPKLLEDWHRTPLMETVRKYVKEVRDKSDIVVLLAHVTGEEETQVLEQLPEVAVAVTGHIHRGIDQPLLKDGRIVVRLKGYGEELG